MKKLFLIVALLSVACGSSVTAPRSVDGVWSCDIGEPPQFRANAGIAESGGRLHSEVVLSSISSPQNHDSFSGDGYRVGDLIVSPMRNSRYESLWFVAWLGDLKLEGFVVGSGFSGESVSCAR